MRQLCRLTLLLTLLLVSCESEGQPADFDGDGVRDIDDCAPADADIYPGAAEDCFDELDNDCDTWADCADADCNSEDGCDNGDDDSAGDDDSSGDDDTGDDDSGDDDTAGDDDSTAGDDDSAAGDDDSAVGDDDTAGDDDAGDDDTTGDDDSAAGDDDTTGDDDTSVGDDDAGDDDTAAAIPPILDTLDFETNDGGLIASGNAANLLWEWGAPFGVFSGAYSGSNVWATGLGDNYFNDAVEYLQLPTLDLSAATDPTLSFRFWIHSASGADGLSLEIDPGSGWQALVPATPPYQNIATGGVYTWTTIHYRDDYSLVAVSLEPWAGGSVDLRWVFLSDWISGGPGAYIDDVGVHEEASDPDADGIAGVLDEYLVYGSDPFVADSDFDGSLDGDEIADGSDVLDPADYPGGPQLVAPTSLSLSSFDDGGLATTGTLWEHGYVTGGPASGHTGVAAWATVLDGNYFSDAVESLYLPPLDLSNASNPTLSFRFWLHSAGPGDGLSLEINSGAGWQPLSPDTPGYQALAAVGVDSWTTIHYQNEYSFAAVSLQPWAGAVVRVRLLFVSDWIGGERGAYIDDIELHEEGSDPDGDGVQGVLGEYLAPGPGTDPFVADTDGDGTDDGPEGAAGTDPLNPADVPGATAITVGTLRDFEFGNTGGLATDGGLWEWGLPSAGPSAAHSGNSVWATSLAGRYFPDAVEYLYLPIVDLSGLTNPSLHFRLWMDSNATSDGVSLEVDLGAAGWYPFPSVSPAYTGVDLAGAPAWTTLGGGQTYDAVEVDLSNWADPTVKLRFVFRSDWINQGYGAYIDDIELFD